MSRIRRSAGRPLRTALAERVVIADGAMGSMLQGSAATLDDFAGHEGCNEILNVTRPDIVRSVHDGYLDAGVDAISTNTFGANLGNLGEYGISDRIFELSLRRSGDRARCGRRGAAADGRPRWVLGSIGPGTKLPTLGHVSFAELRDAYQLNAAGLLAGGADGLIVETCQDLLQAKAAIIGARRAIAEADAGDVAADRAGDDRDHGRDAARQRDRGGAHRARAAGDRRDRAELRDRAGRDERAPALPGRARASAAVLHAERRAARAHLERRLLPGHAGRAGRRARDLHPRVRARSGRRLLRHDARASGPGDRQARRPAADQAQAAAGARSGLALPARAVPAGHRVPVDRRADQRERLQGVPRGDDRRAAWTTAWRSRARRPGTARTCSTCAWTMSAGTAWPTWPRSPAGWRPPRRCRSCSTRPSPR